MLQCPTLLVRFRRNFPWFAAVVLLAFSQAGCGMSRDDSVATTAEPQMFSVLIERGQNGAALSEQERDDEGRRNLPRVLAFKVVGAAPKPDDRAQAEARIAATQAAIIDAFRRALFEARQSRGQSVENFTARLGPRMTITHRLEGESDEIRIKLTYRGIENTLAVRDGVLQHPPVDLRLIRRIFEETNGEFSLLETDTTTNDALATATVACYLPAGFDPTAKVNVARVDDDAP